MIGLTIPSVSVVIVHALLLLTGANATAAVTYDDVDSVVFLGIRDGDTFSAKIPEWPDIIGDKIKIRLSGIDCQETRKSQDSTHQAQRAKAFTERMLENAQVISLKNLQRGSFFRIIADVEVDGKDLGQMLLDSMLAAECTPRCRRVIVYASPARQTYHLAGCRHLARIQIVDTLAIERAGDKDMSPCKVCKPPGFEPVN